MRTRERDEVGSRKNRVSEREGREFGGDRGRVFEPSAERRVREKFLERQSGGNDAYRGGPERDDGALAARETGSGRETVGGEYF